MKILLAIKTCHKYRHRADAQRQTWVPEVQGADVRFFLGEARGYVPKDDEEVLSVDDGYLALPAKAKATFEWALNAGYDFLFHCDDDTYVRPERLLQSGFAAYDYVGRLRGPSGIWPAPYCSGFGYWLSRRAMQVVVGQPLTEDTADDRHIGNVLIKAGLNGHLDERYRVTKCDETKMPGEKGHTREDQMVGDAVYGAGLQGHADYRYAIIASPNGRNTSCNIEGPRQGNDIIAACEFEPAQMHAVHQQFHSGLKAADPQNIPEGTLSKVCVLIKTFYRDGFLFEAVKGIEKRLPDVKMVVVDDGFETPQKIALAGRLRRQGHQWLHLPRDSGFGAKANVGVKVCDRPYVLIGSDDFNFEDRDNNCAIRQGIENMVKVLDNVPEIGVVSGRVDHNAYEFKLDVGEDWARATPGYRGVGLADGVAYQLCDLTVNYSLIRKEVFDSVQWDNDVKIGGGEHGAFFIKVKRAGWKVAYIPGVNINQLHGQESWLHPQYQMLRRRALAPERPCYDRIGIKHFITSGGCEQHGPSCPAIRETVTA